MRLRWSLGSVVVQGIWSGVEPLPICRPHSCLQLGNEFPPVAWSVCEDSLPHLPARPGPAEQHRQLVRDILMTILNTGRYSIMSFFAKVLPRRAAAPAYSTLVGANLATADALGGP